MLLSLADGASPPPPPSGLYLVTYGDKWTEIESTVCVMIWQSSVALFMWYNMTANITVLRNEALR